MRRILPVLALVLLGGCRFFSAPPPWVAVSLVEPAGAKCEWVRRELPSGNRTVLATLPGPCDSSEAAWSIDRARGVVGLGALKPGAKADTTGRDDLDSDGYTWRLFEVTFATHAVMPLGAPPDGKLDDFGIDRTGRIRAMTYDRLPANAPATTYRGVTFSVPDDTDGAAALVHSWLWDGKGWSLDASRVVPLDSDSDDVSGGFDWQDRLGPRTPNSYTEPDEDDPSWVNSPELIARLDKAVGRTNAIAGTWRRVSAWPPLFNFVALGPGQTATLVKDDGRTTQVTDGFAEPHELVRLDVRRGYVLSTSGHHVKLRYPDGRVALDIPAAHASFWPQAPKGFAAGLTR